MAKRYYYRVLMPVDLPWIGPDQRRERWIRRGRQLIQPAATTHVIRVYPSPGYSDTGEEILGDYIVTDKPVAKHYTEEVTKLVSRPDPDSVGTGKRDMRPKTSKIKLELVPMTEMMESMRRKALDLPWSEAMFTEADEDVVLPREMAAMAMAGAKLNAGK